MDIDINPTTGVSKAQESTTRTTPKAYKKEKLPDPSYLTSRNPSGKSTTIAPPKSSVCLKWTSILCFFLSLVEQESLGSSAFSKTLGVGLYCHDFKYLYIEPAIALMHATVSIKSMSYLIMYQASVACWGFHFLPGSSTRIRRADGGLRHRLPSVWSTIEKQGSGELRLVMSEYHSLLICT